MDSDTPTDAIPTYDEAFPLLPELDDVQNVIALAMKASWAVSRVCSSQVTQVKLLCFCFKFCRYLLILIFHVVGFHYCV